MAKTVFSDGNPLQGILGTIVNALFLNKIFSHRHDGLDQDGSAPLDYAPDTGAANAYAIALTPALTAHVAGLPIHFKAANANTGASTLAVDALAAVAVKQVDGSDLPAGSIVAGQMVTVIYTGAAYMLTSGRGLATDAEVQAGTEGTKSVTAKSLYNALSALATKAGFAISLAANGYIKFPSWLGGLIIQWGQIAAGGTANSSLNFPVAFPTNTLNVSCTPFALGMLTTTVGTASLTGFTYSRRANVTSVADSTHASFWLALGY